MIFVTVGTHEQPFNRLVRWIDELVENQLIQEEVIIQTGYCTYESKHCICQQWFPYSEMERLVKEARIVITHGGPSSFLMALKIDKIPIVVPRKVSEKEHVNDHQVKFAREVEQRLRNILLVETLGAFKDAISHYEEKVDAIGSRTVSNNRCFVEQLETIVDELFPELEIGVAMITSNLEVQGISHVIMNYAKCLNLDDFSLTIISGGTISDFYQKNCDELGISLIQLPNRKKHPIRYLLCLRKELKQGYFDIAHVHGNQASMAAELFIAWWCGIETRIAHSHNSICEHLVLHRLLRPFLKIFCTTPVACGKKAGNWLFQNQPFTVIPNGFAVENYRFINQIRKKTRELLLEKLKGQGVTHLNQSLIVGHVGCFNHQKNHSFILDVFECIARKKDEAVLLLIGDGPDFLEIQNQVSKHPFQNQILMLGEIKDVEPFYMAMDVFLFPSKYEGLPLALLEAQVSGLPCVVSDVITSESFLSNQVRTIPLETKKEQWADAVLEVSETWNLEHREQFYEMNQTQIENYQIKHTVHILEKLYREEVENK